jgi:putative DNA primase/helicase
MGIIDSANGNGKPAGLLPQHLADLDRSGLSAEQVAACGFRSATDPKRIADLLGWRRPAAALGPCLAIPFPGPDGRPSGYWRFKPDRPRTSKKDGKPVRYESPLKRPSRAYFPPGARAALADPSVPLVVVEGEKKAAKGDQDGFPSVGLVGVYGWQKKRQNKDAPRELIPDLEAVSWQGRVVYLCYDSDLAEKPEVAWAEWHLAEALAAKGAAVKAIRLSPGPGGAKSGLDDYLVADGPAAFRKLLEAAEPAKPPADTRPEIELGPAEFLCVGRAVAALAKQDRELYQRGGQLVRVVRTPRRRPGAG